LLGPDAGLEPLKRMLVARTEGNPFFLEESVRSLVETEALSGERGAYRLTRPLPAIQVPATVQAILAARIDRLTPDDKALLQTASVIGKDVPFALLLATAALAEDELRGAIGRLQAAEFLYEVSLFPDLEYTFKHALTHEVAYGSLLQERRRTLHARIVDALEWLYPGRLAEHIDRLADHALRGEVWEKAVAYLRQAGAKAITQSGYRKAVARFEQALGALSHVPKRRETLEQAIDVRLELRNPLWMLAEHQRVSDILHEADTLARTLNDRRRLGWISAQLANSFVRYGQHDRALDSGRQAVAIARETDDISLQVLARFQLATVYRVLGDYPKAVALFGENLQGLEGDQQFERFGMNGLPSVMARAWLSSCHAERGEFPEALTVADEGVRIAESVDHPFSVMLALWGAGYVRLRQGDVLNAIPRLERAVVMGEVWQLETLLPGSLAALGYACALAGRLAEALPFLKRSIQPPLVHLALFIAFLSEAHLLARHHEDARPLAQQALDLARSCRERAHEAWALRLLGEIHAQDDPPTAGIAETHYHQALALAETLGMRPLVAHCHLGLGKLYRRTGNLAKTEEHLTTASAMYREMDMGFWLAQADAAPGEAER
jgi:tetratricopeptide (TPR) repeat protein